METRLFISQKAGAVDASVFLGTFIKGSHMLGQDPGCLSSLPCERTRDKSRPMVIPLMGR